MHMREGGGHLHISGMKTGMSLCLEKVNNGEMEGSVWNEELGSCGSPGNKNVRGWFPRELGRETGSRDLWLPINHFEIESLFFL